MKLKTFLLTLLLFLVFLNGGILVISIINLNSSLSTIKERCLGEHYFIVSSYTKDLYAVEQRGIEQKDAMEALFPSYSEYYGKGNVRLAISEEGTIRFSNFPEGDNPPLSSVSSPATTRTLSTQKHNGKEYITVTGTMPDPYGSYSLTYFYDLTEILSSWQQMTQLLFGIGVALSVLFSISLMLVLSRVFRPLQQISTASKSIAHGEYANRLPVRGNDELAEMAGSFNHMADEIQSQMEKLKEAAEQKQRFIDNLAHELRTPLTTIYGYAEYMQKAVLSEQDKLSATDYIMSESRRMQNIANRLLDLATLRAEDMEQSEIPVQDLFQKVQQTLAIKIKEKQVDFQWQGTFDTLTGDRDLLESLLINLTENAIKACEPNEKVQIEARIENGNKIIQIQDNGKGMAKEQLEHITEAFYRVDKARSRAEGGAGLGLALCEQIAALHHASLVFSSHPGKGTTVTITFTTP